MADHARQERIVAVVGYLLCGGLAAGLGCLLVLGPRFFEWDSAESFGGYAAFVVALVLFAIGLALMLRRPKKPLRDPISPLFIFGVVVVLPGFFILVEVVLGEFRVPPEMAWGGLGAFAAGAAALAVAHTVGRRRGKAKGK